jgi:hypothetical protein
LSIQQQSRLVTRAGGTERKDPQEHWLEVIWVIKGIGKDYRFEAKGILESRSLLEVSVVDDG